MNKQEFSKYERARIIGARGLQISMDAPLLVDIDEKELDDINFDALKIAEKELDSGVLPISISRPMPKRKEEAIENIEVEHEVPSDEVKIAKEKEIMRDIVESGNMTQVDDSGEGDEGVEKPVDEAKIELE
ncbi:DNA-directed RNA polymerase subunit K [Candidatus Pacearchaeota archaeon]|nr:DNA-directed RNA polymerase subunit K [Candidatus Pacearchaeota archaeon]